MKIFLLSVFAFLFASCRPPAYNYSHIKIAQVIDGDTVRLEDGRLLRYIGIDTPEIRIKDGQEFIYKPQPFALEAKELNAKLCEGKYARIEFDVERNDIYGRLLGYCFIDDIFVNAEILKQGIAVTYTYPPNVKYADLFATLQKAARADKRGFWREALSIGPEEAVNYLGQIATVEGEVSSTHKSNKVVILNLGQKTKKSFSVVIFKNSWPYFEQENIDLKVYYRDKIIQTTGRIKAYRGRPQIIASHPREIKVLAGR